MLPSRQTAEKDYISYDNDEALLYSIKGTILEDLQFKKESYFLLTINSNLEPDTYKQAISCLDSEQWIASIIAEIKELKKRDT